MYIYILIRVHIFKVYACTWLHEVVSTCRHPNSLGLKKKCLYNHGDLFQKRPRK